MAEIIVIDREGVEHSLPATVGWSVMEIVRESSLPMEAACGGCCACATCHVYVAADWLPRLPEVSKDESNMLDEAFQVQDNSRLSCQLPFTPELDGITVTLAPEF